MVSLSDFNGNTAFSIDQFLLDKRNKRILNKRSTTNVAAHAAVLSDPNNVLKDYGTISSELESNGTSARLDKLLEDQKGLDTVALHTELQKVLSDPNINSEDKQRYIDGYSQAVNDVPDSRSLSVLVAQNAAMVPIDKDENDETVQTTTFNLERTLANANQYKAWVQAQVDANNNFKDQAWYDTALDFAESVIPFMDQAAQAKLAGEYKKDLGSVVQSIFLTGDSKESVRNALRNMPIDQRMEATKKLIEVIKNGNGSFLIRPNQLRRLSQLNELVDEGNYSEVDKNLDNIFSVLDIATLGIGKTLETLFKGGKAAKETALIAERASIAQKVLETSEVTTKVAEDIVQVVPNTTIDNIINNSRGFDKATSEEIAKARSEIGFALEEGLNADEIVERTPIFDKFNSQEIDEFKRVINTPQALTSSVVEDKVLNEAKNVIADNIINSLPQLDSMPSNVYQDIRDIVQKRINNTSIYKPKRLSNDILKDINGKLSQLKAETISRERVGGLRKMIETESNVNRLTTRTSVDHNSLSQTLKDANPGKARSLNDTMEKDLSGNVANATYGTSRAEAIANDRLPEVANVDGSVRNKPTMNEPDLSADMNVVNDITKDTGRIDLTNAEKASTRASVKTFWQNITGLTPRAQMSTIDDVDNGVKFSTVYGPKDGGFKNAQTALEQAILGLRKYGVLPKEIEILGLDELGNYSPVKGIPKEEGNYLVRVNHNYEFSPGDIVNYSDLPNSKLAMFDTRTSLTDGRAGGMLQHLIPATAIINNVIIDSASAASDAVARFQKKLLNLGKDYASKFTKLDKRQKALVDAYRLEANEKGLKFSEVNLRARGLNEAAIDTLKAWKTVTDTMWVLENRDVVKTLRLRGWELFKDDVNGSELIVKSTPNRGYVQGVAAYDSELGQIVEMTKAEVDELYAKGGNIAETRSPIKLPDDSEAVLVVVRQNSLGSYSRRIRDSDVVLPYRDGYYPVKYKNPIFIEKKYRAKDGSEGYRAVATAGSLQDGNQLIKRLRDAENTAEYRMRPDYRRGTQEYDDANWSTIVASGRSSQRIRGQRLADAAPITDLNHTHIESPEESLISSIRSLAARTAFRDWTETTKARWLEKNKNLLSREAYPTDVREIARNNLEASNLQVKDAKATWRYIDSIENGYVNLLDDFSKNFLNNMADLAGRKGVKWAEKGLSEAAIGSPSNFVRKKTFRLLLASNPLRQLPVQAIQALPVMLATNPLAIPKISMQIILLDYLARGGSAESMMKMIGKAATGMNLEDAKQLAKHWAMSGFEDAVDAHTLIRDDLSGLVDRKFISKVQTMAAIPLNITQKYGFNLGEKLLMRSVWLSEYDLLRKSKVAITNATLDKLNARVRNLTLNMNRAGEMPYNENILSGMMQFFQAPHKAFAQILIGHTGLTKIDRLKLGASYVLTYGIGGGWLTDYIVKQFNLKEGDRELIESGLFNVTLNSTLSTIFKEDVRTDFSDSLRLLQIPPVFEFWKGMMNAQVGEVLSGSPSASLVFGNNPRVTNFVKQLMRPFTVDDNKKPEEIALIGKSFLDMFSGASNFFKARYALEHNKVMSTTGRVSDDSVGFVESIMKAAGFNTIDEQHFYALEEGLYKSTEKYKQDIKLVIDETSRRLAARGVSNDEVNWYLDMMAEAQRVFKNDPFYMEEFSNQIEYKAKTGDWTIFKRLLDLSKFTSTGDFENLIQSSSLPENAKQSLRDTKKLLEGNN